MTAPEPDDAPATVREVSRLHDAVNRLSLRLEQLNLADLLEVSKRPWKLVWTNFVAGLARGVGMFLGAGVAGAVTLGLLTWLVYHALEVANMIPVLSQVTQIGADFISKFIAQHAPKK